MKRWLENVRDWFQSLSESNKRIVVLSVGAIGIIIMVLFLVLTGGHRGNGDDSTNQAQTRHTIQAPVPSNDNDDAGTETETVTNKQRPTRKSLEPEEDQIKDENQEPDPVKHDSGEGHDRSETRDDRQSLPQRLPSGQPIWDNKIENPAQNNPELDQAVTDVTYVLDTIVNDPDTSVDGFNAMDQELQSHGLEADGSIVEAYELMDMSEQGDNVFASRANAPNIRPTDQEGVYEVRYNAAAAVLPYMDQEQQSKDQLRESLRDQMTKALNSALGVPVTFTVDFNQGMVSVNPQKWW